eukprot:8759-Heterococcus_DN1.PRE.4
MFNCAPLPNYFYYYEDALDRCTMRWMYEQLDTEAYMCASTPPPSCASDHADSTSVRSSIEHVVPHTCTAVTLCGNCATSCSVHAVVPTQLLENVYY